MNYIKKLALKCNICFKKSYVLFGNIILFILNIDKKIKILYHFSQSGSLKRLRGSLHNLFYKNFDPYNLFG